MERFKEISQQLRQLEKDLNAEIRRQRNLAEAREDSVDRYEARLKGRIRKLSNRLSDNEDRQPDPKLDQQKVER